MHRAVVALTLTIAVASSLAAQTAPDFSEVRRILREGMARESAPAAAFAVVLVNKGVAFAGTATDAALAAVLPKYAEAMKAKANAASTSQAAATPATPPPLDSTMVGVWAGVVRTAGGEVPVHFTIATSGAVQARIGARSDSGFARASNPNRLVVRIPGDLEAANPVGMSRETRMYLDRRGAGFGGVIATRPPSASGLDGSVSYWIEIARRP